MEANFNQPQRQSLVGILVIFLEMIFQLLKAMWPIIVITLLKANSLSVFIGSLTLLAVAVYFGVYSFLKYRNFTFYIDEENEEVDQVCIDIAMIFMAESKIDYAYEILGIGDKHNPKNIDLLFELAFCQEQKSLLPEAIATYLRIIDIDTYIGEAWFNLGQIHFILNEFEEAIEAYDYALVINEKDSISLLQKAHAHFQLNQLELAIETYLAYTEMITEKWQVMLFKKGYNFSIICLR